jgi:hypothetical protein
VVKRALPPRLVIAAAIATVAACSFAAQQAEPSLGGVLVVMTGLGSSAILVTGTGTSDGVCGGPSFGHFSNSLLINALDQDGSTSATSSLSTPALVSDINVAAVDGGALLAWIGGDP